MEIGRQKEEDNVRLRERKVRGIIERRRRSDREEEKRKDERKKLIERENGEDTRRRERGIMQV